MNGPQTVTANFSAAGTQVSSTVFVIQLYRDLLDRNPDPGGLNYWLTQLNSGTSTRTQVAANFFTSPEFVSGGLYIVKLYLAVLNRDPDYGGWLYWFNAYQASTPTSAILASFLSSPEFTSRYGNLTDSAFVTLVYQNVLGRQPDPSGLQYYVNLLGSNQLTRAAVFDQFVQSSEYGTKISPRAYANLLYMGFLRRSADPSGLTYWTNTLTGNPLTVGVDGFINSPEYLTRLQQLVQ